eukprot:g3907.t1
MSYNPEKYVSTETTQQVKYSRRLPVPPENSLQPGFFLSVAPASDEILSISHGQKENTASYLTRNAIEDAVRRSLDNRKGASYNHLRKLETLAKEEAEWWPANWRESSLSRALATQISATKNKPPQGGSTNTSKKTNSRGERTTTSEKVSNWLRSKRQQSLQEKRRTAQADKENEQRHVERQQKAAKAWAKWLIQDNARRRIVSKQKSKLNDERNTTQVEIEKRRARRKKEFEEKEAVLQKQFRKKKIDERKAKRSAQLEEKRKEMTIVEERKQKAKIARLQWLKEKKAQQRREKRIQEQAERLREEKERKARKEKWGKKAVVCSYSLLPLNEFLHERAGSVSLFVHASEAESTEKVEATSKAGKSKRKGRSQTTISDGNLYARLGVSRRASPKEIKKAYRKLSRDWHPDRNPPEMREECEKNFVRLSRAYSILSNTTARKMYDRGEISDDGEEVNTFAEAMKRFHSANVEDTPLNWIALILLTILCIAPLAKHYYDKQKRKARNKRSTRDQLLKGKGKGKFAKKADTKKQR